MMVVILFLCLLIGANPAAAGGASDVLGFAPKSSIRQTLLESNRSLEKVRIPVYRSGVGAIVENTVSIVDEFGNEGAGVLLADESARAILGDYYQSLQNYKVILTAFHVVSSGGQIIIFYYPKDSADIRDSESVVGDVLATLPEQDLALVLVEEKPEHIFGASVDTALRAAIIGSDVQAVGHPEQQWWTYSRGYISQIRDSYSWFYSADAHHKAKVIQTQTPISPGSSGGPLFSKGGQVIGINCFQNEAGQNLNFAVAASEFNAFKGALGVSVQRIERRVLLKNSNLTTIVSGYRPVDRWQEDGVVNTLYENESAPDRKILARQPSEGDPYYLLAASIEDEEFLLVFEIGHQNAGAVFRVTVLDGQNQEVASGWDFDGDFEIDYLL